MELRTFYAVTDTSIYEVSVRQVEGHDSVAAKKVAKKGESHILLNEELGGNMVAVAWYTLLGYTYGKRLPPEDVNTRYWKGSTSRLTGLFLDLEEARKCLNALDRVPWDDRWGESSREVLKQIGFEHPHFILSTFAGHVKGSENESAIKRYRALLPAKTLART